MRLKEFALREVTSNPDIIKFQYKLKALGYDLGNYGPKGDGVDGVMGPYTRAAIDAHKKGIAPNAVAKPEKSELDSFEKDNNIGKSSGMPAKGPITGSYGRMVRGPRGNVIPHPGVDIGAPAGSPISAPASGKIIVAGMAGSAGNLIELMSDDGERHRFMHCSKIVVSVGDKVKQGQTIGLVGSTGFSTGPHLHWEKYASSGRQQNPIA
jgi:murein DD-endopeptidase MepM/ murein hydrolase activator NlpD